MLGSSLSNRSRTQARARTRRPADMFTVATPVATLDDVTLCCIGNVTWLVSSAMNWNVRSDSVIVVRTTLPPWWPRIFSILSVGVNGRPSLWSQPTSSSAASGAARAVGRVVPSGPTRTLSSSDPKIRAFAASSDISLHLPVGRRRRRLLVVSFTGSAEEDEAVPRRSVDLDRGTLLVLHAVLVGPGQRESDLVLLHESSLAMPPAAADRGS